MQMKLGRFTILQRPIQHLYPIEVCSDYCDEVWPPDFVDLHAETDITLPTPTTQNSVPLITSH
jgi:hypothetical protein